MRSCSPISSTPQPALLAGILSLEPSGNRRQLHPRGLGRGARRQPADHLKEVVATAQGGVGLERRPDVHLLWQREPAGAGADDGVRNAAEGDPAAHDIGTPAVRPLPIPLAQHHHPRRAARLVVTEVAAQRDRRTQHAEVVGRHQRPAHHFGSPVPVTVKAALAQAAIPENARALRQSRKSGSDAVSRPMEA